MYTNKKIQRDNPDLNGKYPSADHFIPSNQRVQNGKLIKRPPSFLKIKGCSIENPTSLEMQGHLFSRKSESSGPKIFGSLCFGAKSSSVSPKTKYKVRELTSLSSHQSESKKSVACLWSRAPTLSPDNHFCWEAVLGPSRTVTAQLWGYMLWTWASMAHCLMLLPLSCL